MQSSTVRFSLATLMSIVAGAACVFAALRSASPIWSSAVFTFSVGVLLFSLLAVAFRRDGARAFWIGFLLFGWVYLAMAFGPWLSTNIKDQLLTAKALGYTYGLMTSQSKNEPDGWADMYVSQLGSHFLYRNAGNGKFEDVSRQIGQGTALTDLDRDGNLDLIASYSAATSPTWDNFERVGHSLFSLLAGLVGGLLAMFLWRTRGQGGTDGIACGSTEARDVAF